MHIALLHTARVHTETFDAVFADMDQQVTLIHHVAPELLSRAQAQGLDAVRAETLAALAVLAQADAVICTCSTIGPLAEEFAHHHPHVLRIDAPLMRAACAHGPAVLVAICLESTRAPTLDLLNNTAAVIGAPITPEVLLCEGAWPLFEAGRTEAFSRAIAQRVRARVARGGVDCVVLAQASMRGAEGWLPDLRVPVLSAPALAARRAIEIANAVGS